MQIQRRRNGIAAERALRSGARVLGLWLLLFGSALVSGMAIGYEIGVASGWDAGMDKLIALVSGS